VLLDDLVRDAAQRPLQICLVKQDAPGDLGSAHPCWVNVGRQAQIIIKLLPGLAGRGLKGC
jgi:hypothetical protein